MRRPCGIQSKILERLQDVEVSLAGGDDAEARARGLEDRSVDAIDAGECLHGWKAPFNHAALLRQRRIRDADIEAVGSGRKVLRQGPGGVVVVDQNGAAAFHDVMVAFERDP